MVNFNLSKEKRGKSAIRSALKRIEERTNVNWLDGWQNTYPWDNYEDFVDFPDAPPPKIK